MQRSQFTFYRSFWEAVKRLRESEDRLSALEAIAAYALDGEERPMTAAADALFILIKPVLDSAAKKAKGGMASPSNEKDSYKIGAGNKEDISNQIMNKKEGDIESECYTSTRAGAFVPPSYDEVADYCLERGGKVDPQKWYDHYCSNGWRVGRNPMVDWRAAVRKWEVNGVDKPKQAEKEPTFLDMYLEDEG